MNSLSWEEKKSKDNFCTILLLIVNLFLFVINLLFGWIYSSIALISMGINFLTDIFASLAVYFGVKISHQRPDLEHPFGHSRAQPISALIVSIVAVALGVELLTFSVERILWGITPKLEFLAFIVVFLTMFVKFFLWQYLKRVSSVTKSLALKASSIDSRNDFVLSVFVLVSVFGVNMGFGMIDSVIGFLVGFVVIYSGYALIRENIDYLLGSAPSKKFIKKIEAKVKSIKAVKRVSSVKAHYLGDMVQVAVSVQLDPRISLIEAHKVEHAVGEAVESLEGITSCFVHIEPLGS